MFPFYNHPSFPYFQQSLNQNQFLPLNQLQYQLNPSGNQFVPYPQQFYINYPQYQQVLKPTISSVQQTNLIENTQPNRKYHSCNCVNTDCRKEYCICFKNGQICGEKCGCSNCRNKQQIEKSIPFQKKRNVSCNCKKSQCAKKYCQCYANGIKCGQSCHCSQCKNC